jgi:hypothetical protein
MPEKPDRREREEEWTCGRGLAEHAAVPAKIAEYLKCLAENLGAHLPTIDDSDANGRKERDAYAHLFSEYSELARRLAVTAEEMRGYRDLPAARHDEEALSDPSILQVFDGMVRAEVDLANSLRASADRDQELLREARAAQGRKSGNR